MATQYSKYKPSTSLGKVPQYKASSTAASTQDILQTQYDNLTARLGAVGAPSDDRGLVGKLLNLEQDQGTIGDLFEVLDRPGQAIKSGIVAAQQGENLFGGLWEGFSGQNDMTGLEFQKDLGWVTDLQMEQMGGGEKFFRNFATDLLTDPLTYLPAGFFTKGFKKLTTFQKEAGELILKSNVEVAAKNLYTQVDEIASQLLLQTDEITGAFKYTPELARETARKQVGILNDLEIDELVKETDRIKDIYKTNYGDEFLDINAIKDRRFKPGEKVSYSSKGGPASKRDLGFTSDDYEVYTALEMDTYLQQQSKNFNEAVEYRNITSGLSVSGVADHKVYAKYGDDWVLVASAESKKVYGGLTKKGLGKASSASGRSVILTRSAEGVVQFGGNTKLNSAIKTTIQTKLSGLKTSTGASVADVVTDIIEGTFKSKSVTFTKPGFMDAADAKLLEDAARDILKESGWDYMKIIARDGTENMVHFSDIADDLVIKVQFGARGQGRAAERAAKIAAGEEVTRQTRLAIDLSLDNASRYKPAWDDFGKQIFGQTAVDTRKTIEVGLLSFLADGQSVLAKPAKILSNVVDTIGMNLSWKYKAGEFGDYFRKLTSEGQLAVYRYNQRLTAVANQAGGDSRKIIKELFDLNAKVIDGKVIVEDLAPEMEGVVKSILAAAKRGEEFHLPVYQNMTAKNVTDTLNKVYEDAFGVKNAFKSIQKGDQYYFTVGDVGYNDIKKFMEGQGFQGQINLGRKQLSKEYEEFFLKNTDLVDEFVDIQDSIIDLYRAELGVENLPDFIKTSNGYARQVLSEEGIAFLKSKKPLVRSRYLQEGVDLLTQRTYYGTAQDINKGLQAYYGIATDLFDTDIIHSISDLLRVGVVKNQSSQVLQEILTQADNHGKPLFQILDNRVGSELGTTFKYVDDFAAEYGNLYKNLTPDAQKVFEDYLMAQGFEKGSKVIGIHSSADNVLQAINRSFVEVPAFLKGYDKFLTRFKSLVLLTPGFHMNNLFGNSTNMFLGGMGMASQARYVGKSVAALKRYDSMLAQVDDIMRVGALSMDDAIRQLPKGDQQIFEAMHYFFTDGVSQKLSGVRDLKPVGNTLKVGGQRNLSQKVIEANFKLAENMDDVQRFALYWWNLDTNMSSLKKAGGMTEELLRLKARNQAANKTYEALFDYSHYTRFEQDVMKRMIPFYSFMKNNLTFQMQNIVRNPKQYAKLGRAYDYYVSDIAGLGENDMPDYARDNMWIPLPITVNKNDKEVVSFLRTNLPVSDFTELIENPFNRGLSSLAFPMKIPIELGYNRNSFTGQEIKEFAGEKDRMEPGTGVLPFLRDEQGTFAFSGDPTIQHIADNLGLRVPARYITMALNALDTVAGYQDPVNGFLESLEQLGVTSMKPIEEINITQLYQDLERARMDRKRFEQNTRTTLPTKDELALP